MHLQAQFPTSQGSKPTAQIQRVYLRLADDLQKAETLPPTLGYGVFFSDCAFLFLFFEVFFFVVCVFF